MKLILLICCAWGGFNELISEFELGMLNPRFDLVKAITILVCNVNDSSIQEATKFLAQFDIDPAQSGVIDLFKLQNLILNSNAKLSKKRKALHTIKTQPYKNPYLLKSYKEYLWYKMSQFILQF
jgi:hypothetical protein